MAEEQNPKRLSIGVQIRNFIIDTFTLDDVNFSQSIADIKAGVSFKGFNIWILICSILICSLGLNMDSTAVVIGAMLISPLMGPIVGLGLGIGIFDKKLIYKALKNLGVATFISLVTAYIFFKIIPTEEVKELLSRTKPTVLDLLVAFFGGVAGILAASRSITTNVVPGVAIATALMPPLCTAGYGLANGNMDHFFGASYLFLMNCIMISLAAFIVVLYLRYPKFAFVNEAQKKKVRAGIILVVLLISVPSGFFYYNLLQENLIDKNAASFIEKEIVCQPGVYLNKYTLHKDGDKLQLNVNLSGNYVDKDSIKAFEERMRNYGLDGVLNVIQPQPLGFKEQRLASLKTDIIQELYVNSKQTLATKDDEIALLKNEVKKLIQSQEASNQITRLAKSQYDVDQMAVDILVYSDGTNQDTIPTALVGWKEGLSKREKKIQNEKLIDLLQVQLNSDEVKVIDIR
ncbi:MAG: TIGR00341 family protein [Bacteroidia bacterium]